METTENVGQDNQRQAALLGYMAGIIDGEGCIRMSRNKTQGQYSFRVQVGMVELAAIELLHKTFGGTIREERVQNRRSIYRWTIGKKAELAYFLEVMEPMLMIKQPQLQCMKDWLGWAVRDRSKAPASLSDEELLRREELFLRMKQLNAVGAAATTNRDDTREGEVIV